MFIDSHAHLDLVLKNLSQTSQNPLLFLDTLKSVVHISLHPDQFMSNYPLLSQYNNVLFATGIYPEYASLPNFEEEKEIQQLKSILTHYPHIALGEAGIDFKHESYGTPHIQQSLFERQIALAEELNLPIVVHSRESFDATYNSLNKYNTKAIMHCFSYTINEAEKVLSRGDYISFAGLLTYKNSIDLQAVALMVPLDRILFETDAPFLSPMPFRNKKNIPTYVQHTYEYFAKLRNIPIEELCILINNNFTKVFSR